MSPHAPRPRLRWLLTALLVLATGCRTTEYRSPIAASAAVRVGAAARAWEVVRGERERVGMVVLFEGETPAESFYMVRNLWQQDLGLVDNLGRAYRYLPHHKEPAWVGSGTVAMGVERILEVGDCRLFEVPFLEVEPSKTPGDLERRRADRAESRGTGL